MINKITGLLEDKFLAHMGGNIHFRAKIRKKSNI